MSGDEKLIKKVENELQVKVKKIEIESKFFIVDRKEMLFYISKDSRDTAQDSAMKNRNQEDIAIWLNSEFFAQAFAALFDKAMDGD